jgi:hypothetical protein
VRPAGNAVWLSPGATSFSCLCERCLDAADARGTSFLDAVSTALVQGSVAVDTNIAFARCRTGHQVVLRRIERPPKLDRSNARQLQLQ